RNPGGLYSLVKARLEESTGHDIKLPCEFATIAASISDS
ncbi:MAG: hypothetical protein ACI9VS_002700, partial [Candidatus Binatia bacterium]